ncbi:MAG: hypothetical protein GXY83_27630 [Rhodopirellula sp.]|nr:hypothetical protein [Rhodopirellula sp.]
MRHHSARLRRTRDSKPPADPRRQQVIRSGLLVLAMAAIPMAPLALAGGFPETHELLRYPAVLLHFHDAQQAGVVYPRWLPHLAGGYGYPTFIFYQPLFFFVASALETVCAGSPSLAVWAACFAFSVVGTAGVYCLARLFADEPVSLMVTVLYALTPYRFVDLYVRGDLSEFAAIELVPWILCFAILLFRRASRGQPLLAPAAGLAAGLALVVLAHPLIAMPAWAVVCMLLAAMTPAAPGGTKTRFLATGAAAFVLALAVSSVYWYPVVQLRHLVQADKAFEGVYEASLHIVYWRQLFDRSYGFGASTIGDASDGMSFQLGLPHFLLATLGAWFGRRQRFIVAAYAAYVAMILLMLPPSAPLWKHVELLRPFQFPWRLLGVIASLQACCLIGWEFLRFQDPRNQRLRKLLLILLPAATALWHSNQLRVHGAVDFPTADALSRELFRLAPDQWQTFANVDEFLPRTASAPQSYRGSGPLLLVEHAAALPVDSHSPYHLRFKVRTEAPARAMIEQFYFPGWRVRVDGREVPDEVLSSTLTDNGRIGLALPACPDGCTVEAWYAGPPGNGLRWGVAAAAVLVFVSLLVWQDRYATKGSSSTSRQNEGVPE